MMDPIIFNILFITHTYNNVDQFKVILCIKFILLI